MNRRRFLTLLGASGAASATAGCTSLWGDDEQPSGDATGRTPTGRTPTASPRGTDVPHAGEFDRVVNLGETADGEASRSVVPLLREHMGNDTLLYFPSGRYLIDETILRREFENLGLVGRDAVFVPPEGHDDVIFDFGRPGRASGLLFEGFTFDYRADGTGSRPLSALVDDGVVVRDLRVRGLQDAGSGMLRVDVTDSGGSALVERLRLPDGATYDTQSNGCLVSSENRGFVRFRDCHIEGFPDNGLYADPEEGRVEVEGGYFANCDVSCIRVGNDSRVRGAVVRNDTAPEEYGNMRGIRLTHSEGAVVENCRIELREVAGSDGAISLGDNLYSATVRDTEIVVDADDINGIRVKHPEGDTREDGEITIENVAITGSASERAAVEVSESRNCTFRSVTVEQPGSERDGLYFEDGSGGTVTDCRIDVSGRPVVVEDGASVRISESHPPEINTVSPAT